MNHAPSKLLFLGTGASMGVPVVGCQCAVCESKEPHNKRMRPSVLLTIGDKKIMIDCGPDFRHQALRIGMDKIDGIIFTHAHQDHTAGIDDLRPLYMLHWKQIPLLLSAETEADLRVRFHYLFDEKKLMSGRPAVCFTTQQLQGDEGETVFQGIPIRYFSYEQMKMKVNGFRIGDFAYVSDIKNYSDEIFTHLRGVNTLVLSALRFTPSPMHFSLDEAVDFAKLVKAKNTFFMHIAHELDHEKANAYLPENIRLAYDGLELEFNF